MASHGREERRRKIMDRGLDRLALISGQIQTLLAPSSSPSYASTFNYHDERTESSPLFTFHSDDHSQFNENAVGSQIPKHNRSASEISKIKDTNINTKTEPHLRKLVTNADTARAPAMEMQAPIVAPQVQKPRTTLTVQKPPTRPRFFSSKRLNASIIASERTRAICSLMVASLVVLSYIDYALFSVNFVSAESLIASRPIDLILLTDVTIVLARMFGDKRNGSDEVEEEKVVPNDDGQNWVEAVKLLKRGLVAYQAFRAIFIDSSVYLVVVICGLSLL